MAQTTRASSKVKWDVPAPYRAKLSPAVNAYLADVERLYGKPRLSLEEGRKVIDATIGDKLLSDVVIQGRQ